MDERIAHLNKFAAGIADLNIAHNPCHSEIAVVFNDVVLDQYQDSVVKETQRVNKLAVVSKNPDMSYVQELGDVLLEDTDQLPWLISLTITGLPRIPRFNDCVIIDGVKYTISKVKPMNRNLQSLLILMVYPERTNYHDALAIYDIKFFINGKKFNNLPYGYQDLMVMEVTYGGKPTEYSFDGVKWFPFKSNRIPFLLDPEFGAIRELTGEEASTIYTEDAFGGTAFTVSLDDIIDAGTSEGLNEPYYEGGDAEVEGTEVLLGGDAFGNFFEEFDGGDALASFMTLFLRDITGTIVSKDV